MSRLYVCLPPTKLLLRLIERLLAQQIFPVKTTFPVKHLELCKYIVVFFCAVWKRSEREKQQRVDTRRRVAQKLFVVLGSRRSLSSAVQRRVLLNNFIIGRFR